MNPNSNEPNNQSNNEKTKSLIFYQLGIILHRNFTLHVFLLLMINLLVGGVVFGLTSRFYPIIGIDSMIAFGLGMLYFTLLEIILKGLMVRFLYRYIFVTFGIIFYLINLLAFYLMDLGFSQISFLYDGSNIFTFTLIFMVVRMLFTTYVRKSKWIQGGIQDV